jgi:hypothetical protein
MFASVLGRASAHQWNENYVRASFVRKNCKEIVQGSDVEYIIHIGYVALMLVHYLQKIDIDVI